MAKTDPAAAFERRIARAIYEACVRLQAREVMLRHQDRGSPDRHNWIAEALPMHQAVRPKMVADGVLTGDTDISVSWEMLNRYADKPIARGSGATIIEALAAMQPVKWQ